MTRAELIKALEALEGPSKELDAAIVRTLGHATAQAPNADHFVYRRYDDAGYNWNRVPPYTSSIDSALTLGRSEAERRKILGAIYNNANETYTIARCILFGCAHALRLREESP